MRMFGNPAPVGLKSRTTNNIATPTRASEHRLLHAACPSAHRGRPATRGFACAGAALPTIRSSALPRPAAD
eukprot:5152361-Alexandrium_andersonii.AAC.1